MSENHDSATSEWVVGDPATLGSALRARRRELGWTQGELADASGLFRSYVSDIERGRATEQTERILRLVRRLDLELVVRPRRRLP